MHQKVIAALILLLLLCNFVFAEKWWDKKPFMQWSVRDLYVILTESPWAAQSTANPYPDLAIYQFNLLTARPIREALLRSKSLTPEKFIRMDAAGKNGEERERDRLSEFVESNPENLIIEGDEAHIIVSLCLRLLGKKLPSVSWIIMDEAHSTELLALDPLELMAVTMLETETGKKVMLFRYEPAGRDNWGAKFYFKRRSADGSALVSAGDKELLFRTRLDGRQIKIKFDLRKMIYKGKLEL
jgi:hypothetical protein